MLDSIEIRNFKKIGENGLKLDKLTNVNYLVGENGCGKSSVLEALMNKKNIHEEKLKLHIKLGDLQIANLQDYGTTFSDNQINKLKELKIEIPSTTKNPPFSIEIIDNILPEYKRIRDIYNRINSFLNFNSSVIKLLTSNEIQFHELRESYDRDITSSDKKYWGNVLNFKFDPNYRENLIDFLNKLFFKDNEIFDINRDSHKDLLRVVTKKYDIIELNSLAGGYQFLYGLYNTIIEAITYNELNTLVLIEEPEIALHPKLQKLIPEFVNSFSEKGVQFLISTHSPFIVSAALELDNQKVFHLEKGELAGEVSKNDLKSFNSALDGLGVKPSDMMFANGVVWVEGPTDAIYIEKWLEMYQIENVKTVKYRSGLNYQFQMYGGALLKHYTDDTDLKKSITDMLKINTKRFVVFDSDIEEEVDKSTFGKYKTAVMDEIKDNNFYWYDTEIKTIEDYIPDQSRAEAYRVKADKPKSGDKYKHAIKNIQKWEVEKLKLENFDPHLEPQIAKVFKAIESWNK